ncbi:hypothetical protein, unknown function [Leishmania tarentolae]|uniref:Uncharacterized protein n=1 Tax=Leishmania tarentolae TaxID=5689 RepID=A0A640KCC1_LEITA|nr:hypothetical protein, unknown function [Leishmania tarentolae]
MSHPYATNEPQGGVGNDTPDIEVSDYSPSSGTRAPVSTSVPLLQDHADGNINAHSSSTSCIVEKKTLYDNTEVIHGRDEDDMGTVVSHSPDVSSPSSSSCCNASSMPPSRFPSRSSSCSSATSSSLISASDCSSGLSENAGLVTDGAGTARLGQSYYLHQVHQHGQHPQYEGHCSDTRHVVHDDTDRSLAASASRRAQTSELTRFTSVLAGGRRCGDSDGHGTALVGTCDPIDGELEDSLSRTQDVAWWRRSCAAAASVTVGSMPTAVFDVHPYCCSSNSPQSPLQSQERGAGIDSAHRDVAASPHGVAPPASSAILPCMATPSGTLVASPTPLPPPHPRRSSSAQHIPSKAFSKEATGGAPCSSKSHYANQASRKGGVSGSFSIPAVLDGSVQLQQSRSTGCSTQQTKYGALCRSFSFTSGVPPMSASIDEVASPSGSRAASPVVTATASLGGPRTSRTGERQHERTASIASSAHSASSSVRPSVPLPPSHVGMASNMMATVWVDLPLSQSGSRSATPLNSGDPYAQPRRRRTTPRRCSEPPSPATSTLAASVASSLDGAGYMSSATGGAPASAHRLLVTVSTQTDNDPGTMEDCTTPVSLPRRLYAKSFSHSPYAAKASGGERCGGSVHQYNLNSPFGVEGTAVATAASVSSTSAEVSQHSLLGSVADVCLEDCACQAVHDADSPHRAQPSTAGDVTPAAVPKGSTSLSIDAIRKVDNPGEGESLPKGSAEPPGAVYVYPTLRVDVPPLQRGTKDAAAPVDIFAPTVSTIDAPAFAPTSPGKLPVPTPFVTELSGVVPTPLPESETGASPVGSIPPPTTTRGASDGTEALTSLTSAGGEGKRGGSGGELSAGCGARAPLEEGGGSSDPQTLSPSQSDEVGRLRAELATMRLQYEEVLQQLRQIQESTAATGPAAGSREPPPAPAALNVGQGGGREAVLSTTSPSLLTASPSSSSRSGAIQSRCSARENICADTVSFVSSNSDESAEDATTTLDHVRAALQRARQRATT